MDALLRVLAGLMMVATTSVVAEGEATGRSEPVTAQPDIQTGTSDSWKPHAHPLLGDGPLFLPSYQLWKQRLLEERRLDYTVQYTPQVQLGTVDNAVTANGEFDFWGTWNLLHTEGTSGSLTWWYLNLLTYTDRTTSEFAESQGVNALPNNGDTSPDQFGQWLAELYWEQTFEDWLTIRAGQFYAQWQYAVIEFMNDDRASFMAQPLAGPYGANFADSPFGLGGNVTARLGDFHLTAGVQDAQARYAYPDVSSFSDGRFFYVGELSWRPVWSGEYEGRYTLTYSYADRTGPTDAEGPGHSVIVSVQQYVPGGLVLLGRYVQSYDRLPYLYEGVASLGVASVRPLGRTSDLLAVGGFLAEPSTPELGQEFGLEFFWRVQVTQRLDVTPDLQVIFQPALAADSDPRAIFGLRARLVF